MTRGDLDPPQRPGPLPPGRGRGALIDAVAAELAHLPRGAAVVVALSGGPYSTALAYLATEARPDLIVTLVHVRHGLRDDTEDVVVVERHAAYLGLALEITAVAVARSGRGLEAAARDARYAALRRVASDRGAEAILVGHTADDQAETVVLRIARGTGVGGLAAMRPRSADLVRPLLRLRRADLRRFVALEGLPVASDPTNDDARLRRVLVRSQVLPLLGEVGPDPVGALGRLAALAAEDDDALGALADAAFGEVAVRCGDVLAVRDEQLERLPAAVQRRLWRRVFADLGQALPPPAAVIADLLALRAGRRLQVGALEVSAGGGWRAVAPRRSIPSPPRP
ncbi:MAG: tRNA lysidine(34) synthetase TilS, partial [Nitriliruptor sp.]